MTNTTYQLWLAAHRAQLESAYHGSDGMPGEPAPAMWMSFEVFAEGRYQQEVRRG